MGALRRPAATGRTRVQGRAAEGVLSSHTRKRVHRKRARGTHEKLVAGTGHAACMYTQSRWFVVAFPLHLHLAEGLLFPPESGYAAAAARTRSRERSMPSPGPRPRLPRRQRACGSACPLPVAAAVRKPPRADLFLPVKSEPASQFAPVSTAGKLGPDGGYAHATNDGGPSPRVQLQYFPNPASRWTACPVEAVKSCTRRRRTPQHSHRH